MARNVAQYIRARASAMGLDPRAVLAVAKMEGLGGGVGDNGTSFGPFQLHIGGAMPKGISNPQKWATSPAGINYALQRIAGVARGEHGAQAIADIVSRFERPANPSAEIAGAEQAYGGPIGSSPKLGAFQAVLGGAGGGAGSVNPVAQMLLAQGMQALEGNSSPQQQGATLLQMALARKALGSGSGAVSSGGGGGLKSSPTMPKGGFSSNTNWSNIRAVDGANIRNVDPRLLSAINQVAKTHGVVVSINSGYRSPQHSVAVGGFANDPHTRGIAVDAYVDGKPIGAVFGPSIWQRLGIVSGDVPNFYKGSPDPEHLQIG